MPGQQWAESIDGGYLASPRLSALIRHAAQPLQRVRQFVRPEPGFGKKKSDRIYFDRISNVATAGGTINETDKMPETKITISQGSVVVNEYGNSVPWTGKLEELSELDVDSILTVALKNDQSKTLNLAAGTAFKTCKIKYTPTGTSGNPNATWATSGTVITAATRQIQTYDVKQIVDYMLNVLFVPFYDGQTFVCLANRSFLRNIMDDSDWKNAALYGKPELIFKGEAGMYYSVRFVEDNHALAKVMGTSAYGGEALFFGEDPVVEGVAVPEELRAKVATDYGRDKGIAWYYVGGFATTFDTATAGEAKIIHVTST